jgi:hypothetical protein
VTRANAIVTPQTPHSNNHAKQEHDMTRLKHNTFQEMSRAAKNVAHEKKVVQLNAAITRNELFKTISIQTRKVTKLSTKT